MNKACLCSWSGGKDSCFALMQAIQQGYSPRVLLNVLNEKGKISRSHGIPAEILKMQADKADLPIHLICSSWEEYERNFTTALHALKEEYGLTHSVFGDIDLQAHRDWEEKVCNAAGLTAVLPLWKKDRKQLVLQMLETGMETMIVSCNETMGETYIGQQLTVSLVEELEKLGVDPCGENGEYHTLVLDCSLFSERINVSVAKKQMHENYWFAQLEPT
jgi:diphthine-ammonia ligase